MAQPLNTWVTEYLNAYQEWYAPRTFRGNLLLAKGDQAQVTRGIEADYPERFLIGSITKTMTAVAILQLSVKGTLKLTDSIRTHIQELPVSYEPITLEQLLSHRSGMASFTSDPEFMKARDKPHTQAQVIKKIIAMEHLHKPGETYAYSNSGYYLLGVVIQRVSGQRWAQYLDQHIFQPAKMKNTNAVYRDLAQGWTMEGKTRVKALRPSLSLPFSAGAVASTADDLLAFSRALLNETLLPRAVVQRMWDYGQTPNAPSSYGLGFVSLTLPDGQRAVGHNGGIDGFSSSFYFTPSGEWTAVTLANNDSVSADAINIDLLIMASTNQGKLPVKPPKTRPFDPKLAARLAGDYKLSPKDHERLAKIIPPQSLAEIETITLSGDQAYLFKPVGQQSVPLEQLESGALASPRIGLEIEPIEKDGVIKGFTLRQGGLTCTYNKQ